MRIAVIGDMHWGARSDKAAFQQYFAKSCQQFIFPYLWEHNITQVIQCGDFHDRRKYLNYTTLYCAKRNFLNEFGKNNLTLHIIPGNHDCVFKNKIQPNGIEASFQEYFQRGTIKAYIHPTTVNFGDTAIDFVPWILQENEQECLEFIKSSKSPICVCHPEINGFEMDRGHVFEGGIDRNIFKRYELVIGGHFHHRSNDGQVYYVGTPWEITWADYDDPKGIHILDTDTRQLEFIRNPFVIHIKTEYNDTNLTLQEIEALDFRTQIKDCIVKVVVTQKNNPLMFDAYMDRIYAGEPLDVTIVESYIASTENIQISETDDTLSMIYKSVDSLELDTSVDRGVIKSYLQSVLQEAQSRIE